MICRQRSESFSFLLPVRIILTLSAWFPFAARAATPEQVDAALDRAKAYIYSEQKDGLWEKRATPPPKSELQTGDYLADGGQWGGTTALAVYALLASGEPTTEPRLEKAIKFLQTADIKGVYALGLRAQLYNFLPVTKITELEAREDVARLEIALFKKGAEAQGLFDYLLSSTRGTRFDHSVSQYGVLGAWACERAGAEVKTEFWRSIQNGWIRDQQPDGSWCYGKTPSKYKGETAAMTVAGIATLFITQNYVDATNGINCTGNVPNPHIDSGLKWIGDNFERVFTDKDISAPYYALYGVERVGVASGRKFLGAVNWYQRGADFLVANQSTHGSWGSGIDTCFAMLFLARGRAPVLFNKLQYENGKIEGGWNERPRDIANLTRWISKHTERDLNWQIVSLDGPVAELLDAPVLYISGSKPLELSPADEAKLRTYCEDGGLIMGNPDCGSTAFAQSFRKMGTRLFHDYEFRNLPAKHPVYTNEQYPRSKWKPAPTVLGLSNGVRELLLLTNNTDPAKAWQTEELGHHLADFELATNIALYAIDKKNLIEKGATFTVTPDQSIKPNRNIKLARLQFAGNWNPEPGGWRRLAAILLNKSRISLEISPVKLGTGELASSGAKVADLTGTNAMHLSDPARQELKNFLASGGTLIVDAAGGDTEFAAAAEGELQAIIGPDIASQLKTSLPANAVVFNLPGGIIKNFAYRPFARLSLGSMRGPLLTAVMVNDRPAVYYSRIDLSNGLVGQQTDGIVGYDPAVATEIMRNLVILAGLGDKAPVYPTR